MGRHSKKKLENGGGIGKTFSEISEITGIPSNKVLKFAVTGKGVSNDDKKKITECAGGLQGLNTLAGNIAVSREIYIN